MNEENTVISSREEHCLQVLPTQVNVRIYAIHTSGPVLAEASANLNGCFTIRGRYRDACFPSEREFRQQFRQAVLDAYEQALYQLPQRQQEYQAESTQNSESM